VFRTTAEIATRGLARQMAIMTIYDADSAISGPT
jgi:hypothetical protein